MNMRYIEWTFLTSALLSLVSKTYSKSLAGLDIQSTTLSSTLPEQLDPLQQEELDQLKLRIRNKAKNPFSTMSQLNQTIAEKRALLRKYRDILQELNQLDDDQLDYHETVHKRDIHSYTAEESESVGIYKYPVNIAQPDDHRKETKVQSAILKLHRKPFSIKSYNSTSHPNSQTNSARNVGYNTVLLVYQTLPGNMRRLVTSKVISLVRTDWIKIDITEIAQSWVDEPGMNHGIEIECSTHNISHILTHSNAPLTTASLDIITYDKTINTQRKKRSTQDTCVPGSCCRQRVEIPLAEVGMHVYGIHEDNETIEAFLCTGRCPRNHKLHNTWSGIKNQLKGRYSNMRNKCAPVAFESYIYTHLDEGGYLTWTSYDDIIVKECGCV